MAAAAAGTRTRCDGLASGGDCGLRRCVGSILGCEVEGFPNIDLEDQGSGTKNGLKLSRGLDQALALGVG